MALGAIDIGGDLDAASGHLGTRHMAGHERSTGLNGTGAQMGVERPAVDHGQIRVLSQRAMRFPVRWGVEHQLADMALDEARAMQPQVESMTSTAANVMEIARMAPMRWKQRDHVETYVATVHDLDNAVRDARVLARKTSALLRHGEHVPPDMDLAIDALAKAVEIFADDLSQHDAFDQARQELVEAARMASAALPEAMTMNSASVAAQVRSLAADLLYASGFTRDEIDERLEF